MLKQMYTTKHYLLIVITQTSCDIQEISFVRTWMTQFTITAKINPFFPLGTCTKLYLPYTPVLPVPRF